MHSWNITYVVITHCFNHILNLTINYLFVYVKINRLIINQQWMKYTYNNILFHHTQANQVFLEVVLHHYQSISKTKYNFLVY